MPSGNTPAPRRPHLLPAAITLRGRTNIPPRCATFPATRHAARQHSSRLRPQRHRRPARRKHHHTSTRRTATSAPPHATVPTSPSGGATTRANDDTAPLLPIRANAREAISPDFSASKLARRDFSHFFTFPHYARLLIPLPSTRFPLVTLLHAPHPISFLHPSTCPQLLLTSSIYPFSHRHTAPTNTGFVDDFPIFRAVVDSFSQKA